MIKIPRGYVQLVVYLKDEKEREEIKQLAKQLNTSVSELVRAFFRSLVEQRANIQVNTTNTQINIGALTINIVNQQNQQVNINITLIKNELKAVKNILHKIPYVHNPDTRGVLLAEAQKKIDNILSML